MKCNKRSVIYRNVEERQNSANFQWWVGSLSLSKLLNNKNTAVKLFIYQGKMFHDYSKISKSLHFMTCVISNPVRKYFLALSGPIIIRKKEVQFMSALSRGCCHTPACGHRDMLLLQLQGGVPRLSPLMILSTSDGCKLFKLGHSSFKTFLLSILITARNLHFPPAAAATLETWNAARHRPAATQLLLLPQIYCLDIAYAMWPWPLAMSFQIREGAFYSASDIYMLVQ